jgi:hypothetical protein
VDAAWVWLLWSELLGGWWRGEPVGEASVP